MAEFIYTIQGKPKLVHKAYQYTTEKVCPDGRKIWRCELRTCRGRTHTKNGVIIKEPTAHNHDPAQGKLMVLESQGAGTSYSQQQDIPTKSANISQEDPRILQNTEALSMMVGHHWLAELQNQQESTQTIDATVSEVKEGECRGYGNMIKGEVLVKEEVMHQDEVFAQPGFLDLLDGAIHRNDGMNPDQTEGPPGSGSEGKSAAVRHAQALALVNRLFQDSPKLHHHYKCLQSGCRKLSLKDTQEQSRLTDRFQHHWLSSKDMTYCKDTGLWWLVYCEGQGMFCLVCRMQDSMNAFNKQKKFSTLPSFRYKKSALVGKYGHRDSKQHQTAVAKVLMKCRASSYAQGKGQQIREIVQYTPVPKQDEKRIVLDDQHKGKVVRPIEEVVITDHGQQVVYNMRKPEMCKYDGVYDSGTCNAEVQKNSPKPKMPRNDDSWQRSYNMSQNVAIKNTSENIPSHDKTMTTGVNTYPSYVGENKMPSQHMWNEGGNMKVLENMENNNKKSVQNEIYRGEESDDNGPVVSNNGSNTITFSKMIKYLTAAQHFCETTPGFDENDVIAIHRIKNKVEIMGQSLPYKGNPQ